MDRIYVKHQNKVPVHQLGLNLWRDVVVRNPRIRDRLHAILQDTVMRERAGDVIDRSLMRSITMASCFNFSCPTQSAGVTGFEDRVLRACLLQLD